MAYRVQSIMRRRSYGRCPRLGRWGRLPPMSAPAATRLIDAARPAPRPRALPPRSPRWPAPATRSCWTARSAPARPRSPAPSCAPPPATRALEVPSPTFTLVQSYATRLGTVHHFDLWRLDGPAALAELGWDEARDDIVLVEWPDRLGALRPTRRPDHRPAPAGRPEDPCPRRPPRHAVRLARPHRPPGMTRARPDRGLPRPPRLRRRHHRPPGAGRQLPPLPAPHRRPPSRRADGRPAARGRPPLPPHRRPPGAASACPSRRSSPPTRTTAWCWRKTWATRCCRG